MAYVHAIQDPELLDEHQVHALTKLSLSTLRHWRCAGREIPFVKMGRSVAYVKTDVLEYIARNRREPINDDTY